LKEIILPVLNNPVSVNSFQNAGSFYNISSTYKRASGPSQRIVNPWSGCSSGSSDDFEGLQGRHGTGANDPYSQYYLLPIKKPLLYLREEWLAPDFNITRFLLLS
jgi:hypothetical protein